METAFFLRDLVVLFGIAVLVSYVFRVLKLSTIAGFLVSGAVVGPFGLGLISNLEDVQRMSEIGVMLLLFSIGVEFSAEKLFRMKWVAIVGGGLQLALTTGLTALTVYALVGSVKMAVLAGMLAALSSTVIGLRLLYDRGQTHSPQGSVALAILIFQDLAFSGHDVSSFADGRPFIRLAKPPYHDDCVVNRGRDHPCCRLVCCAPDYRRNNSRAQP